MSGSDAVGHLITPSAVNAGRYLRSRTNSYSRAVSKSPSPVTVRASLVFASMCTTFGSTVNFRVWVKLYSINIGSSYCVLSPFVSNSTPDPIVSGSQGSHVSDGVGLVRKILADAGETVRLTKPQAKTAAAKRLIRLRLGRRITVA